MPDIPTPPNGKLGLARCIKVSLIAPPPKDNSFNTRCVVFSSSLNKYKLNGLALL